MGEDKGLRSGRSSNGLGMISHSKTKYQQKHKQISAVDTWHMDLSYITSTKVQGVSLQRISKNDPNISI